MIGESTRNAHLDNTLWKTRISRFAFTQVLPARGLVNRIAWMSVSLYRVLPAPGVSFLALRICRSLGQRAIHQLSSARVDAMIGTTPTSTKAGRKQVTSGSTLRTPTALARRVRVAPSSALAC